MARTGLFGGSFNPVHTGHLLLAERAREEGKLTEVLFVPAPRPPHKPKGPLAPASDRLHMLHLAVEGNPQFRVSDVELVRQGPSYTLLTVRELKRQLGPDTGLVLILGTDSILELPHWWRSKELVQEVEFIGLERPGYSLDASEELYQCFGAETAERLRDCVVDAPLLDISASDIRERARRGSSIRYLVPEAVRRYIIEAELYARG